ncbi:MAG: CadC-family transcriptional regulator, partial [Kiloniellales bacterium]|nr:CadC-family transcriptional regulator [Kiloniellales bacterium]
DPWHEGFVRGVVEDITTALSDFPWLTVSARSSSSTYKGWAVDIRRAGQSLGVNYILEGSIRDSGDRIRVTARLVDAVDEASLWASHFDIWDDDVVVLQDLITARVVSEIGAKLEQFEIDRTRRLSDIDNPISCYMRGLGSLYKWTREGIENALGHFHKAIQLDPEFPAPYGMSAYCYVQRKSYGWISNRHEANTECLRLVQRASELSGTDGLTLARAAHAVASVVDDPDMGELLIEQALRLNPSLAIGWYVSGWISIFRGDHRRAVDHLTRAKNLSPYDPLLFKMNAALAYAYFFLGNYEQASVFAAKGMRVRPTYLTGMRGAAACHALAGRLDEARMLMARMHQHDPALSLSNLSTLVPFQRSEDMGRWADALGIAGLPE